MKKNFMAIASLLIAAMLLMVSCSQEVKAPENNGLVEAKLSVGFGRGLSVTGYTKTDSLTYKYSMTQGWTSASGDEAVIGTASDKVFTDNSPIGYVTPGLWNITVDAYENTTNKKIFTGSASVYFSSQNSRATVYLAPVEVSNNKIEFEITMQDLSKTPDADFELEYSIYKGSSDTPTKSGTLSRATVDPSTVGGAATNISKYTKTESALESGYYRVTVSVYDKKNSKTVGGITKGFLISNDATAKISGHIEPSDYENVTIDAVFVDVDTVLSVSGAALVQDKDYYKVDYVDGSSVKVTVTMTDDNTTIASGLTVSKTLFWNTFSDETEVNDDKAIQTANSESKEFTFTAPGHKYVTCTTVYAVTGTSTGMTETTYYYADTQEVHIYVDPTNYNNSLNRSN